MIGGVVNKTTRVAPCSPQENSTKRLIVQIKKQADELLLLKTALSYVKLCILSLFHNIREKLES